MNTVGKIGLVGKQGYLITWPSYNVAVTSRHIKPSFTWYEKMDHL
jgi:hypothetical protein